MTSDVILSGLSVYTVYSLSEPWPDSESVFFVNSKIFSAEVLSSIQYFWQFMKNVRYHLVLVPGRTRMTNNQTAPPQSQLSSNKTKIFSFFSKKIFLVHKFLGVWWRVPCQLMKFMKSMYCICHWHLWFMAIFNSRQYKMRKNLVQF